MLNPIGIIGAGGWGIALAKLLADKGEQVTLWCHRAESFRELQENRESRTYLTGIVLPSSVEFTRSIEAAVTDKSLVICPSVSCGARSYSQRCVLSVRGNSGAVRYQGT
jgi:glycerol-3-phosphate dehydrogenase (NAD(P)+)